MDDYDSDESIKSHKEIIGMIDKLRNLEDIPDFEQKIKKPKNDFYEIKYKDIEPEDKNPNLLSKFKIFNNLLQEKDKQIKNPNIFNIGFNKNGELVNLDLKKKKTKNKSKINIKNLFKRNKKVKTEKKTTQNKGKLKNKLSKISKLKKVIPSKKKPKSEETKEEGSE